jgi:hypothetical protein
VKKVGLKEEDVHDVWNIFMCTGFTKVSSDLYSYAGISSDYILKNEFSSIPFCQNPIQG